MDTSHKRPLSNAEVIPKFAIEANVNEALEGVKYIKYVDGNYVDLDKYSKYDNFVFDWRDITTFESVEDVITLMKEHADQIYGIRFPGCLLEEMYIDQLIFTICDHGLLKYLVDIDLSYIMLSRAAVKELSSLLDPAVSGYCPIKRMQLCHCDLKPFGMQSIFEACKTNVFLNEMNISGNAGSDTCCAAVAKCLENPENQFVSLSLGDNNISVAGLRILCPGLARHCRLRALLLSNNYFGDDGASALIRALKKSSCVEELNISNCGLTHCKWAKHLKYVSSLVSLNVSCNDINDFGCLSLCNGVQACPYLRHLDMSNNGFGGVSCAGLGVLLETHGGLYSLNLSYCTLAHQVWATIGAALTVNKTLILLDVRWCNMTVADACCICEAFESNDVCSVDFSFNPVPDALFVDCRASCPDLKRSIQPSTNTAVTLSGNRSSPTVISSASICPLPLNEQHLLISLQASDRWREEAVAQLNVLLALQEYDDAGLRHEIVDEDDEDGLEALMKDEFVRVVYGNFQEEIGVIKIHGSTTYEQVKSLITPLIKTYLGAAATGDVNAESLRALLHDFTFILKNGEVLAGTYLKVN
jgi:hypothetical protein